MLSIEPYITDNTLARLELGGRADDLTDEGVKGLNVQTNDPADCPGLQQNTYVNPDAVTISSACQAKCSSGRSLSAQIPFLKETAGSCSNFVGVDNSCVRAEPPRAELF